MSDPYIEFFLTAAPEVRQLELFELTHPNLSRVYRYVRNQRGGVTVTIPGEGPSNFEYRPIALRRRREQGDLSEGLSIDLGDPGEVVPSELDLIKAADGFNIKPRVRYWAYRSDDLTTPLAGPLIYEAVSITTSGDQSTIEAQAPERNASGTGGIYTFTRFPMLTGFI